MTAVSESGRVGAIPEREGSGNSDRAASIDERVGMLLALVALIAAAMAAGFYLINAIQWRSTPFFGALVTRSLVVDASQPLGEEQWTGLSAGLIRRDQITRLNGQDLGTGDDAISAFQSAVGGQSVGAPLTVEFLRPVGSDETPIYGRETCALVTEGLASCQVTYPAMTFPDGDFLAFFVIPFVSGLITLVIGAATFVLRPRQPAARTVAALCAFLALFMMGLFDLNTTYLLNGLWMLSLIMVGGSLISFVMVFPVKAVVLYANPLVRYVPIALSLMASGVMVYLYLNPPTPEFVLAVQQIAVLWGVVASVIAVLTLISRRRRAATPMIRDQSNSVLIGFALSLILGLLWLLNTVTRSILGADAVPLNTSAAMPFMVLPCLSMAYAVLQYRSVDTDRVLSQGITYGVMLFALISGYFLLVLSASLVLGRAINAADPVLIAAVIFVVAVLFIPVRTGLQKRIDRVYFRQRVDYQQRVERFSQEISTMVNADEILSAYRREIEEALIPSSLFIFLPDRQTGDYSAANTDIRFAADSPIIEYLFHRDDVLYLEPGQPWSAALLSEKSRLNILKAKVISALRGSNRLNGFIVIGVPRSGSGMYTYEELRFVQNLTTQISVAAERALVVDSLERRVHELDVLSQVSQAANFSVDFDTLLELISTQAGKLIDAPHFYITLREPVTNELYHAFFLEGEDRDRERENSRWTLGRDLFSEVIRSNKPLRVTNFIEESAHRGVEVTLENPQMRAWMGVPMSIGAGALGVLSAGTADPDVTFSEEQHKIFGDIAALAATSIDKARLFNQTNVRARQLQALNDISRRIVASEAKLEELLQLITASATEILNADAGSLLLTADDGSRDLIFRVAIGGSATGLVGVRVPKGRGLVGEVASTGKPVIVNDVKTDPRWAGELAKGSFTTHNVLAVPLITQDSVIGVLEVLNKRDGGFSPDEVDLLTTFAGQAAVAIENARLFQQTDLQLSQRVSELETLERIDIELTRTLDLAKIAQITASWAMENSSATAALLGIVVSEPPQLQVIYREGYDDDDLPEGAEGDLLPLDRGIVSRVMRTRQAEVVPDVRFDRDYIPSLRGALSQITLPMVSGGSLNAILILETNREPRLRIADMPFLTRLTEHASIAIVNAQLYAELNRANQSKSEFVSFVAHELKNPLTSIRGYSDLLLGAAGSGLNDAQKNFLSTIRNNADRMNNLVSDLNDVTKLQTNNMRIDPVPTNVREVIEETVRPLEKQIENKGQTLRLEVEADLPLIKADPNRLIQVLTNLVSNAYKYSPEEGEITIMAWVDSTLRDQKGRQIPAMVHIAVRDTGIGMGAEDLAKLFTPYFRSENPLAREQPGTGLGLTITQGIIKQHGGEIWVESVLGAGTTFHFTVPLAEETVAK